MDETRRHNDDDYHEYRIRPYQQEKSNTIPTSQLSAIISRRTYNQWRDLTPESAIPRTKRRLRVSASCIPTTLATSKKPGGQRKQQRQLEESQNGGDKKCNFRQFISEPAESTSADSNNSNNPVETQVHEEARDPDDEDKDKDDSTLLETADNRGQDDILSKITEDDQKEMLQQNRMLLKLLFEQQAEWKERTRMLSELDRSRATDRPEDPGNQSKIFKMVDPLRYCGRAKELDKFLETLRSNFASHKHLFPRGDPDQVNDRRKIRTHPSGLGTYERPRTRV
jgi:hypothetical protein